MMRLQLNLLGAFQARESCGRPVAFPRKKAEALLAFLALHPGQAQTRDSIATLLWGNVPDERARHSLRQTLVSLRQALAGITPSPLLEHADTVALEPAALEVDVGRFEQLVRAGTPDTLGEAAALYRGELLAGIGVREAAFEDWLLGERERLREQVIDALTRLIDLHTDGNETERAVQAALHLLAIDPLAENAHRALMRLYAEQGRRAAALRQYQLCVSVLRRELGAEPERETRSLYNELLRHRSAAASPAPALPIHETPLIGRTAELASACAALDGLRSNRGHIVSILGEAGIGKTRLTEELVSRAVESGVSVLAGHCYESQRLFPFAPWVELLRAAGVPADLELLEELGPVWRAELSRLLPEIADGRDEGGEDSAAIGPRRQVFEAMLRLLARLNARGPLLLILEDLHWADAMSLRLLASVGRRIQSAPAMIALTAREEELQSATALRRTLQELEKGELLTKVSLAPLSRDDTAALVRALTRAGTGGRATERLAERVWQASEGNPFVVVESMRAAGGDAGSGTESALSLPERVRDLVQSHLERLSPAARQLISVAAVAGTEVDFFLLRRAAAQEEHLASEALEELVRRQLLRAVGERFDFVHDRIRQVVNGTLLAPARQLLHVALAEALETAFAPDLAPVYDRLAYHYSRTDRSEKAVTYLTRFAERAARAGAHDQAAAALDDALAHLARSAGPSRARRRFELVFRKTRSLLLLGRLQEVVDLLLPEQAFVEAARDPRMAGAFYLRLSATFNYLGDRAGTAEYATRALAAATSCGDHAIVGKAHVTLSNHQFWQRPEEGVRHGEQAVAILEKLDEPWWLGQACWILALNLSYRGRLDEALQTAQRARTLGEAMGDRRLACSGSWCYGFVSTLAGDWDAALAACRKGVELAPDPMGRMTASGMLALAHVERREPVQAIAILSEAIPQAENFRFAPLHGLYLGFRGEAALQSGDLAAALEFARRGVEITRDSGYVYGLGWTQRIQGRIALASGDLAQAVAHLQQAIATFRDMGAPFEMGRTHLELGEMLASAGSMVEARLHAAAALDALAALGLERFSLRARGLLAKLDFQAQA